MNKIYKSLDNKIISGVCSGISKNFDINVNLVRFIFIFFSPVTFWLYLLLSYKLPSYTD